MTVSAGVAAQGTAFVGAQKMIILLSCELYILDISNEGTAYCER